MSFCVRQKDIRQAIQQGAKRITDMPREEMMALSRKPSMRRIAYSIGVYGCNGALWCDSDTGEMYAADARCVAIFAMPS